MSIPMSNRFRAIGTRNHGASRFSPRSLAWAGALAAASVGFGGNALASLSSANYRIEPTAFSGGAGLATSAAYSSFSGISSTVVGSVTSSSYSAYYGFFPSATVQDVTGRFVFYNQSAWDGNSSAANANDDAAIATDKSALLPGGVATFANYTSFFRGINGLMIDLPNGAAPTASDFVFKRGNTSTPGSWDVAPDPSVIAVRAGAGVGGADRVTLIWPNQQILKQWLQVTVLATPNTGLSVPDTFYFGNAVAEVGIGSTATRFTVTSVDVNYVVSNPVLSGAPITHPGDFNRDKRVTSTDLGIVVSNPAISTAALLKLSLAGGDSASPALASLDRDSEGVAGDEAPGVAEFVSRPEISADGRPRLWIAGGSEISSRIEQTQDLGSGTWTRVPADWLVAEGNGLYRLEPPSDSLQRFFRIAPTPTATADAR